MKNPLIEKAESLLGIELINFDFNGKFYRYGQKKEYWAVGKEINHSKQTFTFLNCGNFIEGTSQKFNNIGGPISKVFANKLAQLHSVVNETIEAEREKAYRECVEKWLPIWSSSKSGGHEYLAHKGVHPHNSRISLSGELLIPLYDKNKAFCGVQRISKYNDKFQKRFALGTKTKGSFCFLDKLASREVIYISEGFATAATVQEAIPEYAAVCAFNCGNLKSVLYELKELFPDSKFIIAADLDKHGLGEKKAIEAINGIPGAIYVLPLFKEQGENTDFNDLSRIEGMDQVRSQLLLDSNEFNEKDFELDILNGFVKEVGQRKVKDHDRLRAYFDFIYKYKVAIDHRVFAFDGVMYSVMGELKIKEFAQLHYRASNEFVSIKDISEFYSLVLRSNVIEEFEGSTVVDGGYINFMNGVLEVKSGILLKHDPKYLFTYVIPHIFNSNSVCPTWDLMLENLTLGRNDLILNIEEFLGYALSNMDYGLAPKALILDGSGANGKTTLVNAFKMVLGNKNVSSILVSTINENRFVSSTLFKSLLNIAEEEKISVFKESENFKRLTGGSPMTAEKKGKDAFQFTNRAKLLMTYNNLPTITDRSHGMFRRLLIIPCDQNFTERPDLFISDLEIKIQEEIPGIINKAIAGLKRLKNQRGFTESQVIKQKIEEAYFASDYIASWFNERILITEESSDKETTESLYLDFINEIAPVPQPSKFKFGKEVKAIVSKLNKQHPRLAYGQVKIGGFSGKGITGGKVRRTSF